MKRIILVMAAIGLSFGVMSAQDLATATSTFNSGAEALAANNKTGALEYFQKALSIAEALGEEGKDVATNCKNAIPSTICLSVRNCITTRISQVRKQDLKRLPKWQQNMETLKLPTKLQSFFLQSTRESLSRRSTTP